MISSIFLKFPSTRRAVGELGQTEQTDLYVATVYHKEHYTIHPLRCKAVRMVNFERYSAGVSMIVTPIARSPSISFSAGETMRRKDPPSLHPICTVIESICSA